MTATAESPAAEQAADPRMSDPQANERQYAVEQLDAAVAGVILARVDELYKHDGEKLSEGERAPLITEVARSLADGTDTTRKPHTTAGLLPYKPATIKAMVEVLSFRGFLKAPSAARLDANKVVMTAKGISYNSDPATRRDSTGVLEVLSPTPTDLMKEVAADREAREKLALQEEAKRAAERAAAAAERARKAAEKAATSK